MWFIHKQLSILEKNFQVSNGKYIRKSIYWIILEARWRCPVMCIQNTQLQIQPQAQPPPTGKLVIVPMIHYNQELTVTKVN